MKNKVEYNFLLDMKNFIWLSEVQNQILHGMKTWSFSKNFKMKIWNIL